MRLIAALALTLISPLLVAQNWYEVEVLLFRQDFPDLASPGTVAETWPDQVELAWPAPLVQLQPAEAENRAMRRYATAARKLNNDAFAFRVTPGYELLWHQAWQQPMTNEADAPWIQIAAGDNFFDRYELEGGLRIHLSRFLHVTGNFWLTDFGLSSGLQDSYSLADLPEWSEALPACSFLRYQPAYQDPEALPPEPEEIDLLERMPGWWRPPYECLLPREELGYGGLIIDPVAPEAPAAQVETTYLDPELQSLVSQRTDLPLPERAQPVNLPLPQSQADLNSDQPVRRIVEVNMDRRLRSGEIHYIDHPLMGMIVRLLPIPEPEPTPEDSPEQPLP